MKIAIIILVALVSLSACSPVLVQQPSKKAENFNYKQAKAIIDSQKKVRKKQLKQNQKQRNKEVRELRVMNKFK